MRTNANTTESDAGGHEPARSKKPPPVPFGLRISSDGFTDVAAKVKPATSGAVVIVHDTPSLIDRLRGSMQGMPLSRNLYVRLIINGQTMMTDAEFERWTNVDVVRKARGHALIAGLGIGLILDPLVSKCKSVTVIEKNPDVISLVAPAYPQCKVIEADIFDWKPPRGARYDLIYFDIWADFSGDEEDAPKLEKRFRRYLAPRGWMDSWCRIADKTRRRR